MKTTYLAKAELNLLNVNVGVTNPVFLDMFDGSIFVGLLSALPITGKDGWEGARELYSPTTPVSYLPGVKDPSIVTGSYYPIEVNRNLFSNPSLVDTPLGVSGMATEYQGEIAFPVASLAWGTVLGLVFYLVSRDINRITPLFTVPFVQPVSIGVDDKLTILNTESTRVRAIELIKKNTL